MSVIEKSIEETLAELSAKNILEYLSQQQRAALEEKFLTLDEDARIAAVAKYPNLPLAFVYLIRSAVKEANSKLASTARPGWYSMLKMHAFGVLSSDKTAKAASVNALKEFAQTIDSKERVNLLKKYKNEKDMASTHAHIIEMCGIFSITPDVLGAKG